MRVLAEKKQKILGVDQKRTNDDRTQNAEKQRYVVSQTRSQTHATMLDCINLLPISAFCGPVRLYKQKFRYSRFLRLQKYKFVSNFNRNKCIIAKNALATDTTKAHIVQYVCRYQCLVFSHYVCIPFCK